MEIPKVKGRMFAIQAALPKFPVAPLQQTMDKYLRTCEPLLTEEEFERTKEVNLFMSHVTRKCVFEDFRPGKIQTSLLSYRS